LQDKQPVDETAYGLPYKGKTSKEKIVETWFLYIYISEVQGKIPQRLSQWPKMSRRKL